MITDYLFVSSEWDDAVFQEVIGLLSFEAAENHAKQLAEELQQRVQVFELVVDVYPAAHYLLSDQ